jgi:alpha-glucuronidase
MKKIAMCRVMQVAEITKHVPSFGGFLVKADSEGNKGPIGYNRYEKTTFLSHLYIKTNILPRQARDRQN